MIHNYETLDNWYEALQNIARTHANSSAVSDRNGWTDMWQQESPEHKTLMPNL